MDGAKRDVGISILEDPASAGVGPLVVTQDFAMPAGDVEPSPFIVGVAYHDDNGNGAYDPGEGEAGLVIVPSSGDHHAVTSKSGGFSLPVPAGAGAVKVQIQRDGALVLDEREVTVAADNVKLDFVLDG